MDIDRRRRLEERRRRLNAQIHLNERRALLAHHTERLEEAGVEYEVEFDSSALADWVMERWPTTSRGIDWSEVKDRDCASEADDVRALASRLLRRSATLPDDIVEVLYSNARTPALRMRVADVLHHGDHLETDFEVWVICRRHAWVLEYVSVRGWCFGFASKT